MDIFDRYEQLIKHGVGDPQEVLDDLKKLENANIKIMSDMEQGELGEEIKDLLGKTCSVSAKNVNELIFILDGMINFSCVTRTCENYDFGSCHSIAMRKDGYKKCPSRS